MELLETNSISPRGSGFFEQKGIFFVDDDNAPRAIEILKTHGIIARFEKN